MSRALRLIWLLLGMGSLALLVGLFLVAPTWEVVRERDIAAPPEQIFPWLEDLHAWRRWSPWQETDYVGLTYQYAGPTRGPGAQLSWDSDATGDGQLRITDSRPPRSLSFEMTFQDGKVTARDTLELLPLPGGGTRVVWTDRGTLGRTLLGRLSLPVIERSMSRDLDRGLERLAEVVEAPARTAIADPLAVAEEQEAAGVSLVVPVAARPEAAGPTTTAPVPASLAAVLPGDDAGGGGGEALAPPPP
jgi:uncharacterized protein YndB with AHSA1/START domain